MGCSLNLHMHPQVRTSYKNYPPPRVAAEEAGRPELLLANNEYGLGEPSNLVGFNRFTKVCNFS